MRSLTPTSHTIYEPGPSSGASRITKAAIDPENGHIYAAVERRDEGVEVDILKFEVSEEGVTSTEVRMPGCFV